MGWGPSAPDMTAANTAAASQAKIAEEQWAMTKQLLPETLQLARDQNAVGKQVAEQQIADSQFYRGIAQHQFDRSKLSEPYQDDFYKMADDYASGKVGNDEAGRANADVNQAFDNASASLVRNNARYGINPGSGAFESAMGDMYTQRALQAAGAQTTARTNYRNKAENMVAIAGGMGQPNFTNGMNAGQASGAAGAGAVNASGAGAQGYGMAQSGYNQGAGGAGNLYGQASSNWRNNAIESAKSPGFDFASGLITGAVKGFAGTSDRRLKRDIKRVGTTDSGLGVYTYKFQADGPTFMGVMADEVEKIMPEAVFKRVIDGKYDAVNYAAL